MYDDVRIKLKIETANLEFEIDLDKICWACDGRKNIIKEKKQYPYDIQIDKGFICSVCNGIGYELTENGESILKLFNRYVKFPH